MDINKKTLNLVIADDDPEDQYMMQKVIWDLNLNHKITSVYNGMQLMDYLQRKGMYSKCMEPTPDCIFLDLNMPLLNGMEALKRIKKNPELAQLPVYILCTVNCTSEKEKMLAIGANGFYTKNPVHNNLKIIVNDILSRLHPSPEALH